MPLPPTAFIVPPRFLLSRWLFLRLLAVVYLIAFASLAPQLPGLVGDNGLLPAGELLDAAREFFGADAYRLYPTLAWLNASDLFIQTLCWAGVLVAGTAIAGLAPVAAFAILWVLYLSVTVVGQDFLSFQWDTLLLESGLVAILLAPRGWWPRLATAREPSTAARWLLWLLVFKLTFLSGTTKLVSGDETWRNLTALTYHYMTQPIPAWTSWYAHQLPAWVQMLSAVGMFAVELTVPFTIALPARFRRTRTVGCVLMIALQVFIGATGNYGFFNLLTIVIYLSLLDDQVLARLVPRPVRDSADAHPVRDREPRSWRWAVTTLACLLGVLSAASLWKEVTYTRSHPVADGMLRWTQPVRSVNGYGLFRVMTTDRPEIIVEGSRDGEDWTEYAFRWKPGDPARPPAFVQPYMPRLDWQLWFAALDPQGQARWLTPLLFSLLEGSPEVLALLDGDPFAGGRPRYVRLALYRYNFTHPDDDTGAWWRREFLRYLTDPVSLDGT
jgi:hypothetical protein